ncbi:MAG TPA: hypothetical protein VNR36_10570 [Pseudolysinimonas sp.]|nr:hypothetical protein [Pseudolysinimonas sp.]
MAPEPARDDAGTLRTRPLILTLVLIGLLMPALGVILDLALRVGGATSGLADGIRNITYPDAEGNLFAWYSTIILAAVAVGFFLIALTARGAGRPIWRFVVLGALALLLSADEAAYLHERLGNFAGDLGLSSKFTYQWLLLGVPIAIVVGLFVLWLARRLDKSLRWALIIAGVVYLAGAVGGEVIGGVLKKTDAFSGDALIVVYDIEVLIEEGLEILGAILAFRAVLRYLRISNGPEGLAFSLPPEQRATTKK